mgnify:CR=1 FL=1
MNGYENGYSETINTSKVVFKKILLRWQEKSKYGLSQGTKDNCFNGTGMKLRFNLKPMLLQHCCINI